MPSEGFDEADQKILNDTCRKLPTKTRKVQNLGDVSFFSGKKLCEYLLENHSDTISTREEAIEFGQRLLEHRHIIRATFLTKTVKCKDDEDETKDVVRLVVDKHPVRALVFEDTLVPYIWEYKITPWTTWAVLFAIVLGGVAMMLNPIWPDSMRNGMQYLTWGLLGFTGLLLVLEILRYIVNWIVYYMSGKTTDFWIFPRFDDDGLWIWENFVPLYEVHQLDTKGKRIKKKKKGKGSQSIDEDADTSNGGEDAQEPTEQQDNGENSSEDAETA